MAGLPMIETGYKPEYGLGALYQGFNAANADQMAQEDLLKQFLANQREVSSQPIDIEQLKQNLAAGEYRTTPEYQIGMRDTISGQGMSNLAAGRQKAATNEGDINLALSKNKNEQFIADTLSKLNTLKQNSIDASAGAEGGQIGFPMQQQPAPTMKNVQGLFRGNPQQLANMKKQIESLPEGQEKQEAIYAWNSTQGQASPEQKINANNSPIVQQAPMRNGGVTQGSPQYEALMQALVDQPELRSKLLIGDQKLDSAEFINERRIQAKLQEAFQRARTVAAKLPTMEQAMVQDIYRRLEAGVITAAEATGELNAWTNSKYSKPMQQGVTPKVNEKGEIEIDNKEVQIPKVQSKSGPTSNRDALKEMLSR